MRSISVSFSTILFIASCITLSVPANAKVHVKERTSYYSVTGSTGQEIYRSMVQRGPKLRRGFKKNALATAQISFEPRNIKVKMQNGRCKIASADIRVNIKYTLPKWRGSKRASRSTRNAWSNFAKIAVWHEKQHGKIAKEHAARLEKMFKSISAQARRNCRPSVFKIKRKINRLRRQHERLQVAFDRKDLGRGGRGYQAQLRLLKAK